MDVTFPKLVNNTETQIEEKISRIDVQYLDHIHRVHIQRKGKKSRMKLRVKYIK